MQLTRCNMRHATRGLQPQDAVLHAAKHRTQESHGGSAAQVLAAATLDLDGTVKLLSAKLRKILGAERGPLIDTANMTRGIHAALAVLCGPNRLGALGVLNVRLNRRR